MQSTSGYIAVLKMKDGSVQYISYWAEGRGWQQVTVTDKLIRAFRFSKHLSANAAAQYRMNRDSNIEEVEVLAVK